MLKFLQLFIAGFFLFAGNGFANQKVYDLNSELWWAVQEDDLERAKGLVAQGADVNYETSPTLLMMSGSNGSIEMTDFLLAHGADPLRTSDNGNTTIMYAAGATVNSAALCKRFADLGVDPFARNYTGNHALKSAAYWNNLEAIEYLLSVGVPVDYPGYRDRSAFFSATDNESYEAADYLISHGANINFQDKSGYPALFVPAMNGKLSVARYLIAKGIDVNLRDMRGRTALTMALRQNQSEMAELIRSAGGIE